MRMNFGIRMTRILVLGFVSILMLFNCTSHASNRTDSTDFQIVDGVLKSYTGSSQTVIIPDTVKTIGSLAFSYSDVKEIVIPDGVTSIQEWAFFNLPKLKTLYLPSSVTSISEGAFIIFPSFQRFLLAADNKKYSTSSDGKMLLNKENTILYAYPAASGYINDLPKNLKKIGNMTFYMNKELLGVQIPDTVTAIGIYAFAHTDIDKIILPKKLQSLKEGAFYFCSSLASITLPRSLKFIGNYAFGDCYNLKSAVFLSEIPPTIEALNYETSVIFSYAISIVIPNGSRKEYVQFINSYESGNEMLVEYGKISCYSSSNIITVLEQPGYEYSLNGRRYQTSGVFSKLKPDTKYTVYMRKAATSVNKAGRAVKMTIRTKKESGEFVDNVEFDF